MFACSCFFSFTICFVDPASGGSEDWAKQSAGIKYVYLLELRPDEKSEAILSQIPVAKMILKNLLK